MLIVHGEKSMPLPVLFRKLSFPGLLSALRLPARLSHSRQAVIYEVDLRIDAAAIDNFDDWLMTHMREMLAFPGFQEAEAYFDSDVDESGRHRRLVTYLVRSRRELDSYLHTHASRMRADGKSRFGNSLTASRRILPQDDYVLPEDLHRLYSSDDISGGLPVCSNCHQPVAGRFCASCGQEDRTYLLSLRELLLDFFGDLVNFDSRFFKTTLPLLFKPGYLTAEYLRGRRQAYFPPVRLYIFISIVFFFIAALLADAGIAGMDDVEQPKSIAEQEERIQDELRKQREALQEAGLLDEAEAYLPDADALIAERRKAAEQRTAQETAGQETTIPAATGNADNASGKSTGDGTESGEVRDIRLSDNSRITIDDTGFAEFDERLERGAEAVKENPKAFVRELMDDFPIMMFIFLPVIALILKLLYFFTGRYYVEHLIFTLHFHAAVFALMLLLIVNSELNDAYAAWSWLSGWITALIWIYIPVYLFVSMRVVYGQGRLMTSMKYFLLFLAYTMAALMTILATVMIGLWRQG